MKFFEDFQCLSGHRDYEDCSLSLEHPNVLQNPVCGDRVLIRVRVRNDSLEDFRYRADGCWPLYGCLELLGRIIPGRPVSEVVKYSLSEFLTEVDGVPAGKRHAFSLALRGLVSAVCREITEHEDSSLSTIGGGPKERV